MKLSIIVPVFNEKRTIKNVLVRLRDLSLKDVEKEIIVVNDGSTDGTEKEVKNFLADKKTRNVKLINHELNQGKGAAIRNGIKSASGEYILIQDADLEYNPDDIESLLSPIFLKEASVVYGTRLKRMPNFRRDERTPIFFVHYLGNKMLSLLTSTLYGQWITDMETGYKLIPRKAALQLQLSASGFDIEPEITAKLLRKGYKIREVPIKTNPRGYQEGKKLNTVRDGFRALWTLLRYRFEL